MGLPIQEKTFICNYEFFQPSTTISRAKKNNNNYTKSSFFRYDDEECYGDVSFSLFDIRRLKQSYAEADLFEKSEFKKVISISKLPNYSLKIPISAILEQDDDGFIVATNDLPLYGYGETQNEAINNLKWEIQSLYEDLIEDDNFTEEWLRYKKLILERIAD